MLTAKLYGYRKDDPLFIRTKIISCKEILADQGERVRIDIVDRDGLHSEYYLGPDKMFQKIYVENERRETVWCHAPSEPFGPKIKKGMKVHNPRKAAPKKVA